MNGNTMIWFRVLFTMSDIHKKLDVDFKNCFESYYAKKNEPGCMTLYRTNYLDNNCICYYLNVTTEYGLEMNDIFSRFRLVPVIQPDLKELLYVSGGIYEMELAQP